jgi:hypothetical protein
MENDWYFQVDPSILLIQTLKNEAQHTTDKIKESHFARTISTFRLSITAENDKLEDAHINTLPINENKSDDIKIDFGYYYFKIK